MREGDIAGYNGVLVRVRVRLFFGCIVKNHESLLYIRFEELQEVAIKVRFLK